MANEHATLTSLFIDVAEAIREGFYGEDYATLPAGAAIKIPADYFPDAIRGFFCSKKKSLNNCSWEFIRWASDAGVDRDNIFVDKQSGKDFNRPAYQDLVSTIQPNDMIIIKSIDRLGRNYSEILEQWGLITKTKKVDIKVLDMPLLDTSYCKDVMGTFISDLVLQVLSFQAEQERTYIKQRQAEGIAAAKSNGVQFGRPRKPLPSNFEELYQRFRKNEPITRLAKECPEISESTLRLRLQERFDLDRKR